MHIHNDDPAKGLVCTSMATNEAMTAMGFPVEQVNHGIITSPGMKSRDARMAAWAAGKVRICTIDPREFPTIPWVLDPVQAEVTMAWVRDHRR